MMATLIVGDVLRSMRKPCWLYASSGNEDGPGRWWLARERTSPLVASSCTGRPTESAPATWVAMQKLVGSIYSSMDGTKLHHGKVCSIGSSSPTRSTPPRNSSRPAPVSCHLQVSFIRVLATLVARSTFLFFRDQIFIIVCIFIATQP